MKNNHPIRPQFCTCHDSWAVMTCAKLWPDRTIIISLRGKKLMERKMNFHNISISSWSVCEIRQNHKLDNFPITNPISNGSDISVTFRICFSHHQCVFAVDVSLPNPQMCSWHFVFICIQENNLRLDCKATQVNDQSVNNNKKFHKTVVFPSVWMMNCNFWHTTHLLDYGKTHLCACS